VKLTKTINSKTTILSICNHDNSICDYMYINSWSRAYNTLCVHIWVYLYVRGSVKLVRIHTGLYIPCVHVTHFVHVLSMKTARSLCLSLFLKLFSDVSCLPHGFSFDLRYEPKNVIECLPAIRHFHISHNTPCLPPKFCTSIVFSFSWDDCSTQEKWETKVMQNFGGQTRCIMGDVEMANNGLRRSEAHC